MSSDFCNKARVSSILGTDVFSQRFAMPGETLHETGIAVGAIMLAARVGSDHPKVDLGWGGDGLSSTKGTIQEQEIAVHCLP
jgi:hypothetical protein